MARQEFQHNKIIMEVEYQYDEEDPIITILDSEINFLNKNRLAKL
jgi:hypothetical protein